MRGSRWWWAAVAAALSAASSGCATCKTPPPFFVELTAVRETNRGAATRVLVLQLKNLDAIKEADFDALRKDPPGVLAETLVGTPTEIWINANEAETKWVARDKDARFVAAVAVFQQPGKRWWATHKLKPVGALQCREVPVESFAGRRPYSSEEQMRFYLGADELTTDEAAPAAASAQEAPARKGSGA